MLAKSQIEVSAYVCVYVCTGCVYMYLFSTHPIDLAEHHGLSDANHSIQVGKSLELLLLIVTLDKELQMREGREE